MRQGHYEHLPASLWWVLAGLTLVWGFNWTAMKLAISDIDPLSFRTVCLAAGSGLLFAYLRATRQQLAIPRSQWQRLTLIAFFNITLWNVLVIFGLAHIPSGRAAILAYTMPAWAVPLSVLIIGERMTGRKALGLALGMAGMGLLVWDEFARLRAAPIGALLVLAAALSWAIGTLLQKKIPVQAPVAASTAWMMFVGGVPIYLGAFVFEDLARISVAGPMALLALAYNVLFAFAWGYWAWLKLASAVSVTVFSLSMLVVPVVGVFSGIVFLGERPGWHEYVALLLVLGSLASVVIRPRPR